MRSLTGLMVLFLMLAPGCGEDDKPDDHTGSAADADADADTALPPDDTGITDDTGDRPDPTTDPGWSWGDHVPCTDPVAAISYSDESLAIASGEPWPGHTFVQYGVVGWAQDTDGGWAAVWHEPGAFHWSRQDGTRTGSIDSPVNSRFTMADVDGDGAQDLVVFSGTVEIVWSFLEDDPVVDVLFEAVAVDDRECGWLEIAVGDFDGDGRQDLLAPPGYSCAILGKPELSVQTGDRQFETVITSGLIEPVGAAFHVIPIDLNGDTMLDAYFCNDFGPDIQPNQWVVNQGDGTFLLDDARGSDPTTLCMGTSFGDLNSDGSLDLMVVGNGQQFGLVRSGEDYIDYWTSWGLPMLTEVEEMPWGSAVTDLDNDGLTDLLLTASGFSYQETETGEPVRAWMQTSPGVFEEQGEALGLPRHATSRGLVARDINADGVLDLLVGDYRRSPWVLMSSGCTTENWIEIEAPAGTVVRVESGDQAWSALVSNHQGFGGFGPVSAHIGLGDVSQVDRVTAEIPWVGTVHLLESLTVPRRIHWAPED